jgi:hypothetical protein
MSSLRNERGVALVITVFALVVIGALVAGAFFVGRVEQLTGYNTIWATQAGEAAEAGLAHAMGNVDNEVYNALPVWSPGAPNELALGQQNVAGMPGMVFTDTIRRMNATLFQVRSTGQRRTAGGAVLGSQSLVQFVRLGKPTIGVNAAVTVQDPITFNGNAFEVDGFNSLPPQWGAGECDPVDDGNSDDVVGIRSSTTTGAGKFDMDNIHGFPSKTVDADPTITSETFQDFLDYTYNTLSAQPNVKTLPLVTPYNGVGPVLDMEQSPAVCDKTSDLNFGEPFRDPPTAGAVTQCTGYFAVVHGTGAKTSFAAGNRGQGILLIDGNLDLVGGFEWVGLVIVRGKMVVTGMGNKIFGAVLSEGVNLNSAGAVSGNIEVSYSACAIQKAVTGVAVAYPLSRGWAQTF